MRFIIPTYLATAEDIRRESDEYKAKVEAARLRREKQEAEFEVNLAVWENSQRARRLHDSGLTVTVKGAVRYDVPSLCALAEDYAFEFFGTFFSKEYCGWDIEYDPVWKGYFFPKQAGALSEFLFSATGTLFLSNREEKGEKIPESNYVVVYGHFVCGYPLNKIGRFSPKDYSRAVQGFTAWLSREKAKREGTLFEYGTFGYWTALFEKIVIAFLAGRLDAEDRCTLRDASRNFYHAVKDYWAEEGESLAFFPELATEKTFKAFLNACLEEGTQRQRSLPYFKVAKFGRAKVEKFELIFNPECIPAEEPSAEEQAKADAHCAELMTGSSVVFKSPEEFSLLPEEENSPGIDLFRDENAEAEAEQELVD